MCHPFLLINKLEIPFAGAADGFFVHIFDSFNFGLMLLLREVQKR
jgi:hypothetical protein